MPGGIRRIAHLDDTIPPSAAHAGGVAGVRPGRMVDDRNHQIETITAIPVDDARRASSTKWTRRRDTDP